MKTTLSIWQRTVLAVSAASAMGVVLASASFLPLTPAQAQPKKAAKTQSAKAAPVKDRGEAGAANPEIKDTEGKGNPHPYQPKKKGGKKTRGEDDGTIHIDNESPRFIKVYIDGYYEGEIGPYGDMYRSCNTPGSHRLFAKRVTSDDSYPARTIYLPSGGTFTWELQGD